MRRALECPARAGQAWHSRSRRPGGQSWGAAHLTVGGSRSIKTRRSRNRQGCCRLLASASAPLRGRPRASRPSLPSWVLAVEAEAAAASSGSPRRTSSSCRLSSASVSRTLVMRCRLQAVRNAKQLLNRAAACRHSAAAGLAGTSVASNWLTYSLRGDTAENSVCCLWSLCMATARDTIHLDSICCTNDLVEGGARTDA